jgi:ABC-2 type transport system permease protein
MVGEGKRGTNKMKELKFLFALWKADWQGAMEYRGAFITQVVMMMLNNAFYFVFWVIFFERVGAIGDWHLADMYVLFGVTASAFGLVGLLFGNAFNLSEIISRGRLDYYLSLPRPVLLHALASRTVPSGLGDFSYGILSFLVSGMFTWEGFARFLLGVILAACVFLGFMILVHSLAFWLGNATGLAQLGVNAMISFALYPISLFDNPAKLILFTLIPAALMGSLPAEFIRGFTWSALGQLALGAFLFLGLAILVFRLGLRKYESGSGIQTEV